MESALLKDIAELQAGYQSTEKIIAEDKGSHTLIQAKDLIDGKEIDYNKLTQFFPVRKPQLYEVHKDNILFQARGFNHNAIHIQDSLVNVLAASTFYIIRIKNTQIRPGYLTWWLNQAPVQNALQEKTGSSYMSFVSIKLLGSVKVDLPSLDIQAKMEKLLELTNKEIELLGKLKANKEKLINEMCIKKIEQSGDKR